MSPPHTDTHTYTYTHGHIHIYFHRYMDCRCGPDAHAMSDMLLFSHQAAMATSYSSISTPLMRLCPQKNTLYKPVGTASNISYRMNSMSKVYAWYARQRTTASPSQY